MNLHFYDPCLYFLALDNPAGGLVPNLQHMLAILFFNALVGIEIAEYYIHQLYAIPTARDLVFVKLLQLLVQGYYEFAQAEMEVITTLFCKFGDYFDKLAMLLGMTIHPQYASLLLCFIVEGPHSAQLPECEHPAAMHITGTDHHAQQVLARASIPTEVLLEEIAAPDAVHLHILVAQQQLRGVEAPAAAPDGGGVLQLPKHPPRLHRPHLYDVLGVGCSQHLVGLIEHHVADRILMVQHDPLGLVLQAAGVEGVSHGLVQLDEPIYATQRYIVAGIGHRNAGDARLLGVPDNFVHFAYHLLKLGVDFIGLALQNRIGQVGHYEPLGGFVFQG